MNKVWVIAKREFLVTVTRKGYIFAVAGTPLLFGGIFGISFLTSGSVEESIKSASQPIAVIDRAHIVDFELASRLEPERESPTATTEVLQQAAGNKPQRIVPYSDRTQAIQDLKAGKLSAVYLIEDDYMSTGKIIAYSPERGLFSDLAPPDRGRLYDLIRASLVQGRIDGETRARVLAPGKLKQMKVSKNGDVENASDSFQKAARFFGPFSMFLLLTMSIFFSSGYLLQGIAEEKQNRVIEVIWASVDPMELLAGKILGLGAAGLLQVAFYAGALLLPSITVLALFHVSIAALALSLVYFVLGYLLFAGLMAGTGILGNSPQESGQLSAFWTLLSMIPMFLLAPISEAPNSWLARGLSWFPLTAPVTMLLRITTGHIPWVDAGISIAVLVVSIYLAVKGAAKMFRAAALMYGKRPRLGEIIRWLREA
ncbi:MAG: ABC transporter permease [Acidobacteria bacterium]|nr:ABC transporter permease [Acidobacteriota bacterium]